jgi:hypothetical protein
MALNLTRRTSLLRQLCAVVALLLLACSNLHATQAVTVTAQLDMTSQVALGNIFVTAATEQVTLRVGTTVTVSGAGALPYYNNTGVGLAWNVTDFFITHACILNIPITLNFVAARRLVDGSWLCSQWPSRP